MSSLYRVLCVSHDPAILIDRAEWATASELEAALADVAGCELLQGHERCDLLGGRYSYPLIEVYCPPARDDVPRQPRQPWHPHSGHWVDAAFLRLALAAQVEWPAQDLAKEPYFVPGCWSSDRVRRLRLELGMATGGGD